MNVLDEIVAGVREDVEAARIEDARHQTTSGGELRAELGLGE